MSEQNESLEGAVGELELLKNRARLIGVEFSNNIGLETLKERVAAKLSEIQDSAPKQEENQTNALTGETPAAPKANQSGDVQEEAEAPVPVKRRSLRKMQYDEGMRLIRCRITNLDPKKANLPGEIFTVANQYIGTVKLFVPYGEVTDDGWHLPKVIFDQLDARRFVNIRTIKDRKTGHIRVESGMAKEFALEVLEPLTKEELAKLGNAQRAAGSID